MELYTYLVRIDRDLTFFKKATRINGAYYLLFLGYKLDAEKIVMLSNYVLTKRFYGYL